MRTNTNEDYIDFCLKQYISKISFLRNKEFFQAILSAILRYLYNRKKGNICNSERLVLLPILDVNCVFKMLKEIDKSNYII